MNKPLSIVIKETQNRLASVLNESKLPLPILDLIAKGMYLEVHNLTEIQTINEENDYVKMLEEVSKNTEITNKNVE